MRQASFIMVIAALVFTFAALCPPAQGVPITYYQYFTEREVTRHNELIWFWTPDTLYGTVRSNDFIGMKYSPQFYGRVMTSKSEFRYNQPQNIHFEYPPSFNVAPINLPSAYPHLIEQADQTFSSENGRFMTLVHFEGEDGVSILRRPIGNPNADPEEISRFEIEGRTIVYVDGETEVEGIVAGEVTLYASDDMWLTNDIRYLGSDPRTGAFNPDEMDAMLGLISAKNIIVKDNYVNGKAGGYEGGVAPHPAEPADWNRHSIVINGSLIALDESFTFEHHNDDWDAYQGPVKDERGFIFFKGGIAQKRRGYLHRPNHIGTGYAIFRGYDSRLRTQAPPGMLPVENPYLTGVHQLLDVPAGEYSAYGLDVETLILRAGVHLHLELGDAVIVRDSLIIEGTPEDPVIITSEDGFARMTVRAGARLAAIAYATFGDDVNVEIEAERVEVEHATFVESVASRGNIIFANCRFRKELNLSGIQSLRLSHTLVTGGLKISGNCRSVLVDHCTLVNADRYGFEYTGQRYISLTNSIVAFNRRGLSHHNSGYVSVRYGNVFGNEELDYEDVRPGEGAISFDPLFVDTVDFRLRPESPCIDSGDPDSPPDPDGSRADIGAFAFDHRLSADSGEDTPPRLRGGVRGGVLRASPNPFNSSTVISFSIPSSSSSSLRIYSLSGQCVASFTLTPAHPHTLTLDAPAGIYIARLENGLETHSIKLVKVN